MLLPSSARPIVTHYRCGALYNTRGRFLSPVFHLYKSLGLVFEPRCFVEFCVFFSFLKQHHTSLGPKSLSLGLFWNVPDCSQSDRLFTLPCITLLYHHASTSVEITKMQQHSDPLINFSCRCCRSRRHRMHNLSMNRMPTGFYTYIVKHTIKYNIYKFQNFVWLRFVQYPRTGSHGVYDVTQSILIQVGYN